MSYYSQMIGEFIGTNDRNVIESVEDIMRHEIFHSTLDWQTREQLRAGAIEAKAVHDAMRQSGYRHDPGQTIKRMQA